MMADVMPNYAVEKQRLISQLASLQATVERQKLENMELEDRVAKNQENINSTLSAVTEASERLKSLQRSHA